MLLNREAPGQICITSCQKYFNKKYLLYCPKLADFDNLYLAKVKNEEWIYKKNIHFADFHF